MMNLRGERSNFLGKVLDMDECGFDGLKKERRNWVCGCGERTVRSQDKERE